MPVARLKPLSSEVLIEAVTGRRLPARPGIAPARAINSRCLLETGPEHHVGDFPNIRSPIMHVFDRRYAFTDLESIINLGWLETRIFPQIALGRSFTIGFSDSIMDNESAARLPASENNAPVLCRAVRPNTRMCRASRPPPGARHVPPRSSSPLLPHAIISSAQARRFPQDRHPFGESWSM